MCRINAKEKNATLGYWLGQKYWGKGIMTKAARAVVNFGFIKLDLHKIKVEHFEENIGSQKVIEKCGFKKEGVKRHEHYRFKRWHNLPQYSLLSSEWKKSSKII